MKKALKNVLDVCDLPPPYRSNKPGKPTLRSLVAFPSPSPYANEIIEYMQHGVYCGQCPEMLRDILKPEDRIVINNVLAAEGVTDVQSNSLYTDGEWIWAGATLYYVMNYHPPIDAFVTFAMNHDWKIDSDNIDLSELDVLSFYE
jgi:hypothetical protein